MKRAVTEFCPAQLKIQTVRQTGSEEGASLYGFQLWAFGSRQVQVKLAFDTDADWYATATTLIPPHSRGATG